MKARAWTKRDGDHLDTVINRDRARAGKPHPSRRHDPELADACRKIMAYRLKSKGGRS